MELFEDFGFEPTFFIAQIINFLILAFVFKKFLYKPILKLLNDRKKSIAKSVKDAEKAESTLEDANAQKDEIIKAATLEAERIITETQKASEGLREELLAKSKTEAEKIITESRETAGIELEKARAEAKNMSIEISKKVLGRVLSDFFTKEERQKIMNRSIKEL